MSVPYLLDDVAAHTNHLVIMCRLFVSAVELLQSISRLDADITSMNQKSPTHSWRWLLYSSIPWHSMAIVLTNLGIYFQGPLVRQAWGQIDAAYARYSDKHCHLVNAPIWSPINELRDQARFMRHTWVEEEGGTSTAGDTSDDGRGGIVAHNLVSAFDSTVDVTGQPLELGVDFCADRSFGLDDLVMPDLASGDQDEFLDFYQIPTDQYGSVFNG